MTERLAALVAAAARRTRESGRDVPDDAAGEAAAALCDGVRAPREARDPAVALARGRRALCLVPGTTATTLLDAAQAANAGRRPERFTVLVAAVLRLLQADGADAHHRARARRILGALPDALAVDAAAWAKQGLAGAEIGERVRKARLERVGRLLRDL